MAQHARSNIIYMRNTTTIEITKPAHGSMEWLQLRHRHNDKCIVGSSEVSAIMNASEYETITDLAVRKLQPVQYTTPNEAMIRGNVLEPALIKHAQNELLMPLVTPNVMYLHGRVIATLDARGLGDDADVVVEAKTNNKWALGNAMPAHWWWQAQAQMYCTDTEGITFVVLDKHMRLGMHIVDRCDASISDMVAQVDLFCDAIDEQRLPEHTHLTAPQVATLYKEPAGTCELDARTLDLIAEWQAVKECLHNYEQRDKDIKDAIANAMRANEFATVNGQVVLSYKAQSANRFDNKAFATAHPDLAKQYMKTSSYRVLRISNDNDKGDRHE